MKENEDKLVTVFEALKELKISLIKFLILVDLQKIVSLQSLKFGINLFLPHSEVLRIKHNNF